MKKLLLLAIATIMFGSLSSSPVSAGVNDFTISSFKADYHLYRDNEGRSHLTTREVITAQFPTFDQNHGLERAIPQSYDGHSTSLRVTGVSKQDGSSWNYSTYTINDNLVLRIGDADRYVRGEQTYVITYEQRDVTRFFIDTDSDEFYWDTNGTEWQVPIGRLDITLRVDPSLTSSLTGETGCYQGAFGVTNPCLMSQDDQAYTVSADNLSSGENVTIAVGFRPQTFAGYQMTFLEKVFGLLIAVWAALSVLGVGLTVWIIVRLSRLASRKSELGTIVPEYIPPADASVTTSTSILSGRTPAFAAQLIDFAVRHYVKIYEIEKKTLFGSKDYELEIVRDISDLRAEEQEILRDIFAPASPEVGARLSMNSLKSNTTVSIAIIDNDKKLQSLVRGEYGLRTKSEQQSKWFNRFGFVLLPMSFFTLNPFLLAASISAFIAAYALWPLTDKGLALYRYLEGLKLYIEVAEADRLKLLQSPEGAAKSQVADPNDPKQLVRLYERVLPYAILFGQEKEWNAQLGKYYESLQTQPDWYRGNNGVFSAVAFSSAMSGFSTASSYTSASSSSSGGSGGGGSSGGGGGGGGGGGW